ncbi:MAG: ZIP family metal transporter, partial [Muribaculaceae bacterium]|nr:ZIP family metal transporter [Muribaculaceae bacterium]
VYHATGSKNKAFRWSLLAGLAEPLGSIVAMVVLLPFWSPLLSAILLSAVAGIMVYISIDELLPSAREYGHHHLSIAGFIAGMLLMALSLLFF